MDVKLLWVVFLTAFVAELGDKSQVLTLLYASAKGASPGVIFLGVSIALVIATAIGVLLGGVVARWADPKVMGIIAGGGFILIGTITLYRSLNVV